MGQKMLCKLKHVPHQGQSVCALEDQAYVARPCSQSYRCALQ